jgi:hypothetical protein
VIAAPARSERSIVKRGDAQRALAQCQEIVVKYINEVTADSRSGAMLPAAINVISINFISVMAKK